MNAHNTLAKTFDFNPLPSLRDGVIRVFKAISENSSVMACAHEYERLSALSDEQLSAQGLRRDRLAHHAFRRYMTF